MGRDKKTGHGHGPGPGAGAKERHKKQHSNQIDWSRPAPPGLQARLDQPSLKSKHKSYLEFVENKEKKKKLEYEITSNKKPPPGFEFVPFGNPELTTACKEISRQEGAMIFITSTGLVTRKTATHSKFGNALAEHLHRIGHYFRGVIVEQARELIGTSEDSANDRQDGIPEPIPETQEEINKQADAAIRDLFPRIPNTDRQQIIERSFNKNKSGQPVGLAPAINLSRRVQLATLAHIRHTHTRYDELLAETSWENARKTVESLCLDFLVKWRGDEETGRDQLDEILREVVVISDSDSDSDSDGGDEDDDSDLEILGEAPVHNRVTDVSPVPLPIAGAMLGQQDGFGHKSRQRPRRSKRGLKTSNDAGISAFKAAQTAARKAQRGFKRYEAVKAKWDEARTRVRHDPPMERRQSVAMDRTISLGSRSGQVHQEYHAQHEHQPVELSYESSRNGPRQSLPALDRPGQMPSHETVARVAQIATNHPDPNSRYEAFWTAGASPHRRVLSGSSVGAHRNSPSHGTRDERLALRFKKPRPEELRDYLIPSIEPPSPGIGQSSGPIFVRTVEASGPSRPRDEPPLPAPFSRPAPTASSGAFTVRPHQLSPTLGRGSDRHQFRAEPTPPNSQMIPHRVPVERDTVWQTAHQPTREFGHPREPHYVNREDPQSRVVERFPHATQTTQIVDERGNIIREESRPARYVDSYSTRPVETPRYVDSRGPVSLPPGHDIISVRRPMSAAPIRMPEERRVFLVDEAPAHTDPAARNTRQRLETVPMTAPRPGHRLDEVQQPTYHRIIRDDSGHMHEFVPVSASYRADGPVQAPAPISRAIYASPRDDVPTHRIPHGHMQYQGSGPDMRADQGWVPFEHQRSPPKVYNAPPFTQAEQDIRRHYQQW